MAQLHAKEAPDRVRELEEWGALFDRTKDGRILQRNFGGHKYPRLAHVGDRTGLEMIRTLQQHGIHRASTSTWSARSRASSRTATASPARSATGARTASSSSFEAKAVVLATGGIGRRSRSTRTRGSTRATARRSRTLLGAELHRHGVHAVPPDRHGVAAQRARHLDHRGRPRRRRHAPQQGRQALHVRLHPRRSTRTRRPTPRRRPIAGSTSRRRNVERAAHAGAARRATSSRARSTPR